MDDMLTNFSPVLPKNKTVDFFWEHFLFSTPFSVEGGTFPWIFCTFQKSPVDIPEFSDVFPHSLHRVFHRLWKSLLKTCILCLNPVEIAKENGEILKGFKGDFSPKTLLA